MVSNFSSHADQIKESTKAGQCNVLPTRRKGRVTPPPLPEAALFGSYGLGGEEGTIRPAESTTGSLGINGQMTASESGGLSTTSDAQLGIQMAVSDIC